MNSSNYHMDITKKHVGFKQETWWFDWQEIGYRGGSNGLTNRDDVIMRDFTDK